MTLTALTLRPQRSARRLWPWLAKHSLRRATAAHFDALSDHVLRDIGVERDQIDLMAIGAPHDAMRCSV